MKIVFGNWKYIIKNVWFILPFALLPGLFLALSLDHVAIDFVLNGYLSGNTAMPFVMLFRSWSLIRVDSWLGLLYGVCLIFSVSVFMTLLLGLVEKHMRIGKRTLSGAYRQLWTNLLTTLLITMVYVVLYEIWALLVSAILYSIGSIVQNTVGAYVLGVIALAVLFVVLIYCAVTFYLWYPCLQNTGFSLYDGFRYSYQLMLNVHLPLMVALGGMYSVSVAVVCLFAALLPPLLFYPIAFVLFVVLYLDFIIRMETVYFAADRLDREDELHSYRGRL